LLPDDTIDAALEGRLFPEAGTKQGHPSKEKPPDLVGQRVDGLVTLPWLLAPHKTDKCYSRETIKLRCRSHPPVIAALIH
jgi:hypothetical protein